MSFDPEQWDDDNQARLATIAGVTVGSVESVEGALLRTGPVPFLGTLHDGSSSEGRQVASDKGQRRSVKLVVVVVAESWRSSEGGRVGALKLLRAVANTVVTKGARYDEWQNSQADGPFVFDRDDFMQRAGKRVAYQIEFHAHVWDDFNN